MYYSDHAPPHFHAIYAGFTVVMEIESGRVCDGSFPERHLEYLEKWRKLHQDKLMLNWQAAMLHRTLHKIEGL